jgi:hypothetical protein
VESPLTSIGLGQQHIFFGEDLDELPPEFIRRRFAMIAGRSWPKEWREFQRIRRAAKELRGFLLGISYYSASQFTDPTKCPVAIEVEDERLVRRPRIRGHSRFLHELFSVFKTRDTSPIYDEFFNIVGPEGLCLVQDIDFRQHMLPQSQYQVRVGGKVVRQPSRRLLIVPYVRVDGNRLSPNQLSEGTLKTLALIFYLVVDKGNLLLIEEPEVCVHHGLLKSIIDLIKTYSRTKQIVISTHSDFVLDSLLPENVFLVCKDRKKGTKTKAVTRALSARDFSALKRYLAESGNLGEFWRHGGLEHGS